MKKKKFTSAFCVVNFRLDFFGRLPFPNFHLADKSSWQSSEKMSKQPQGVSFQSINTKNKSFSFAPVPLSPGGERGQKARLQERQKSEAALGLFCRSCLWCWLFYIMCL
ncbi:MAG: hypothetical protein Q8K02_04535 [Flavobacterium sp.]|nr:hypothetical protein [Flavobacterium sp.]